jgi:hypothetical protein
MVGGLLGWATERRLLQRVRSFEAETEGKMVDWSAAVDGTIVRAKMMWRRVLTTMNPPAPPLSLGQKQYLGHLGGVANLTWEDQPLCLRRTSAMS